MLQMSSQIAAENVTADPACTTRRAARPGHRETPAFRQGQHSFRRSNVVIKQKALCICRQGGSSSVPDIQPDRSGECDGRPCLF